MKRGIVPDNHIVGIGIVFLQGIEKDIGALRIGAVKPDDVKALPLPGRDGTVEIAVAVFHLIGEAGAFPNGTPASFLIGHQTKAHLIGKEDFDGQSVLKLLKVLRYGVFLNCPSLFLSALDG